MSSFYITILLFVVFCCCCSSFTFAFTTQSISYSEVTTPTITSSYDGSCFVLGFPSEAIPIVRVYKLSAGSYSLVASWTGAAGFASSIAVDKYCNSILVGSSGENKAYLYTGPAFSDTSVAFSITYPGSVFSPSFGSGVAISWDGFKLYISAPGGSEIYYTDRRGVVAHTIHGPTGVSTFGSALAVTDGTYVAVSFIEDTISGFVGAGSVQIFNAAASLLNTLTHSSPSARASFGRAISMGQSGTAYTLAIADAVENVAIFTTASSAFDTSHFFATSTPGDGYGYDVRVSPDTSMVSISVPLRPVGSFVGMLEVRYGTNFGLSFPDITLSGSLQNQAAWLDKWGTIAMVGLSEVDIFTPTTTPDAFTAAFETQVGKAGPTLTAPFSFSTPAATAYQWQTLAPGLSTARWADIAGETNIAYNTGVASLASHGTKYRVVANVEWGKMTPGPVTCNVYTILSPSVSATWNYRADGLSVVLISWYLFPSSGTIDIQVDVPDSTAPVTGLIIASSLLATDTPKSIFVTSVAPVDATPSATITLTHSAGDVATITIPMNLVP